MKITHFILVTTHHTYVCIQCTYVYKPIYCDVVKKYLSRPAKYKYKINSYFSNSINRFTFDNVIKKFIEESLIPFITTA